MGVPLQYCTQRLKLETSKLVHSLGLPRPIIKSHTEKKWKWRWARGAPEIWGFPLNISATVEASDFNFGTQLGFATTHHKITSRGKSMGGPGLKELPKVMGSPIIYLQRLGQATSNFVYSLGLLRPIIKSHPEEKVSVALG